MTNRDTLIEAFLESTEWSGSDRKPLAGDASNRRYERLFNAPMNRTAVLMDAPPEKGEDIRPFVRIARHLASLGLSAPKIFAQDVDHGFLILEDLGDDLFARVVLTQPLLETPLYNAATDVLLSLHNSKIPEDISHYSPQIMTDMAALSFDWYLAFAHGENTSAKASFCKRFLPLLRENTSGSQVLVQRDYHAENLLWLPERTGPARVGLLDFQDAMAGHAAYDLVSLLQDARRDVPKHIENQMISRYVHASGFDGEDFETAYRILGAQRNLRILGVFTRLCVRDGKTAYIDLIPRVWAHLKNDLEHSALEPVANLLLETLPSPSPKVLQGLKDKCATNM